MWSNKVDSNLDKLNQEMYEKVMNDVEKIYALGKYKTQEMCENAVLQYILDQFKTQELYDIAIVQ